MSVDQLRHAVQSSAAGTATALLRYSDESFELVCGPWSALIEDDGHVYFWVADRMVAWNATDGTTVVTPSLVSLRTGVAFPVDRLITERFEAA